VRRASALIVSLALLGARPAAAQAGGLRVAVGLPPPEARLTSGPTLTITNAFADARSAELLENGFPARVSITAELWASRTLFDDFLGEATVERVVRYDVLSRTYRIGRVSGDTVIEVARLSTLAEVRSEISRAFQVPLPAPPGRRGLYYTAMVTIETFSSDDLAEVQRWLNGDVEPALRGQKNPASALTRGVLTLVSRLLGGDVKRERGRSIVFDTSQ
jgi:hypothetical protein